MENGNKNSDYFKKEKNKLKEKYPKEFIVIQNENVKYHNKDFDKIIEFVRQLEAGTYIIQKCAINGYNDNQKFNSRVAF